MKLTAFGVAVTARCAELGIYKKDLAARVGISGTQLSNILSGYQPGRKHRAKISEVLGLDARKYTA